MRAAAEAAGSVEDNPDDAARAIELGRATGIHPLAIHGDDTFEPRVKAQMAAQIINNNDALQRYINSHPLAAKVSNDDWGGLDQASRSISKVGEDSNLSSWMKAFKAYGDRLRETPALALEGAHTGFGDRPPGSYFFPKWESQSPQERFEEAQKAGGWGAIAALVGMAGWPLEFAFRAGMEGIGAVSYSVFGKDRAEKFMSAIGDPGLWASMGLPDLFAPMQSRIEFNNKLRDTIAKELPKLEPARPWIDAGEETPYGVSDITDSAKEDQLGLDEKTLDAATKDFQATATFTRSPEMASVFGGVHPETKLEVSADAIRRLYGDKEPTAEDGLFGGMPGFIEQFNSAEEIGGGVNISLKDWLRLDPEVIKELKEDVRHREGGVSRKEVEEAKEVPKVEEEGIEAYQGSPYEF